MPEIADSLAELPIRSQVAFAAACAERALAEGAPYAKHDVRADPQLRSALDLAWRYAGGEDLDYTRDVEPVHDRVARAIPNVDDPGADEVMTYIGSAVARTLFVLQAPEKAPRPAIGAAMATLGLAGLLYEDHDGAEQGEEAWQRAAVELLRSQGNKPVQPEQFLTLPDWERGSVYKVFRRKSG
jgi:hypothetical protein